MLPYRYIDVSNTDILAALGRAWQWANIVRRTVNDIRVADESVRDNNGVGRADNDAIHRSRGRDSHTRPVRYTLHCHKWQVY